MPLDLNAHSCFSLTSEMMNYLGCLSILSQIRFLLLNMGSVYIYMVGINSYCEGMISVASGMNFKSFCFNLLS